MGYSILPWTRRGYVGLNVGQSDYGDFSCGNGLFGCDDNGTRVHLYTGGFFSDWLGMELGYPARRQGRPRRRLDARRRRQPQPGRPHPAGCLQRLRQGRRHLRPHTRVLGPAVGSGRRPRNRVGRSLGVGVGWDFRPNAGVVLEWSRNALRVPDGGRRDVDGLSLGYVHRF